jgi:hypothetical protein
MQLDASSIQDKMMKIDKDAFPFLVSLPLFRFLSCFWCADDHNRFKLPAAQQFRIHHAFIHHISNLTTYFDAYEYGNLGCCHDE